MKDLQMYINGQFCESSNGQWINVLNPSTEEIISRQPEGTIEDVNRALDAARAAQKAWAKTPAIERTGYLLKIAEGIKKREKEFTEIIMREQGKTRNWASIEVGATIYGLASSIFTKDLNVAVKACRELEFGETYINREHFEAIQGFHAGVKKSGIGGADGKHGVEEYLVTHVTYLDTYEDM